MTSIAMGNFYVAPPPQGADGTVAPTAQIQVTAAGNASAGSGSGAHQHQSGTGENLATHTFIKKSKERSADASPNSIVEALAKDKSKRAVSSVEQAKEAAKKAYAEKVDNPLDVREKMPKIDPPNPLPTAPILLDD